jgi:hypothetical protein
MHQAVRKPWAAEDNNIPACLLFELGDFSLDIVLNQHRIVPIHLIQRLSSSAKIYPKRNILVKEY